MQPPLTIRKARRKLSVGEWLLVIAMFSVVAGFAIVSLVRARGSEERTNIAVEFANHLRRARLDSIKRSAKDVNQMAQVKIFNRRFYSIAVDGDSDGYLDIPLVMSLPEEAGLEFNGPFPKTYIFDWQGQTVDSQNERILAPPMTVGNSSGASAVKFSDDGKITVIPAAKITGSK